MNEAGHLLKVEMRQALVARIYLHRSLLKRAARQQPRDKTPKIHNRNINIRKMKTQIHIN